MPAFGRTRGQTAVATYGNGVVSSFTYNLDRGWLNAVAHTLPGGAGDALNASYTRNEIGRISDITTAGVPNESWSYTYNDLDELLTADNIGVALCLRAAAPPTPRAFDARPDLRRSLARHGSGTPSATATSPRRRGSRPTAIR
ncbi:MAG: hypothetical protein R3D57_05680 [Hyphomicrobiaceae bacterium]